MGESRHYHYRPSPAPGRGVLRRSRPRGAGGYSVGAGAPRGRGWGREHGRAVRPGCRELLPAGRPGRAWAGRTEQCRLSNRRWAAPGAPAAPWGTCPTVCRERSPATPTCPPDSPLPFLPSLSYGLRKCSSFSSRCRRSSKAVSRNLMRPNCLVM